MNDHHILKLRDYYANSLLSDKPYDQVKWGSKESQMLRFKILIEISSNLLSASLLDYGCGTGELCYFLSSLKFSGKYRGYDLLNEMLDKAKKRHNKHHFSNQLPRNFVDYTVASGIFTVSTKVSMRKEISTMFCLAKKGIAFNSLSSWASKKKDNEYYADPLKTLDFCRTLTSNVVLRHDYLPHDFTIYMYK